MAKSAQPERAALYVVTALACNGGHGPWPAVLCVTDTPDHAVAVAKQVQTLEYKVDQTDVYAWVIRLPFMGLLTHQRRHASRTVYCRGGQNGDGSVREYYLDADLARRMGMTLSMDWEPSRPLSDPRTTVH